MKVAFFYLTAFQQTGGIEKFNRIFLKSLSEICADKKVKLMAYSCYDQEVDTKYFPLHQFKGFNKRKIRFTYAAIRLAAQMDTIILGHINLAILGLIIKTLYPAKRLILITHGIEVWNVKSELKKKFLTKVDHILTVSQFTKTTMLASLALQAEKMSIFHNTLDPYFQVPMITDSKPNYLLKRYGLSAADKVILTVARLSGTELHKGYDKVIEILSQVLKEVPHAKYLIGGKYNLAEKVRLEKLIKKHAVEDNVLLTGFIPDEELTDHYLMSDLFIMPSKKEGFGIVFIEALACGLPVIAGNRDGSAEALLQGKLGTLVDPDDLHAIQKAVLDNLKQKKVNGAILQDEVLANFGYEVYKKRMRTILERDE